MKRKHDKKAHDRIPRIGDKVYAKVLAPNELNYKLGKKFLGPYTVTERTGLKKYTITNDEDPNYVRTVHIEHLKIISSTDGEEGP